MKAIDGYFLIKPEDFSWKPANPMKIPYLDFLERAKSESESFDLKLFWPVDPKQLPKELEGVVWPARGDA